MAAGGGCGVDPYEISESEVEVVEEIGSGNIGNHQAEVPRRFMRELPARFHQSLRR
jgi:hypothetical protein